MKEQRGYNELKIHYGDEKNGEKVMRFIDLLA